MVRRTNEETDIMGSTHASTTYLGLIFCSVEVAVKRFVLTVNFTPLNVDAYADLPRLFLAFSCAATSRAPQRFRSEIRWKMKTDRDDA